MTWVQLQDPPPIWPGYLSGQGLAIAIAKASCDPMGVFGIEADHQNRFLAIFGFFIFLFFLIFHFFENQGPFKGECPLGGEAQGPLRGRAL